MALISGPFGQYVFGRRDVLPGLGVIAEKSDQAVVRNRSLVIGDSLMVKMVS